MSGREMRFQVPPKTFRFDGWITQRIRQSIPKECRRYVPRYCSPATDIMSHRAGGGDGAGEAVACDWLLGGV